MSRHHQNNLEYRLHRGKCHWMWHFVSMTLVALIMAACAPGTGGTGTGPTFNSASLKSNQTLVFINPSLASPPLSPSPTGGSTSTSTASFAFAELDPCTNSQNLSTPNLIFSAQGIEYQQACYGFRYAGEWDIGTGQALSVKGTLVNLNNPKVAISAVLTIVTRSALDSETASITVTLADENNQIKLPSQDIRRLPEFP
jgi:hypothetical protein